MSAYTLNLATSVDRNGTPIVYVVESVADDDIYRQGPILDSRVLPRLAHDLAAEFEALTRSSCTRKDHTLLSLYKRLINSSSMT